MSNPKKDNSKTSLLVFVAVVAAGLAGYYFGWWPYALIAFIAALGSGGYMVYLRSYLHLDGWDWSQLAMGAFLVAVGVASKGSWGYVTQIFLLQLYWFVLFVSAVLENAKGEAIWYAFMAFATNVAAAWLAFDFQGFSGEVILDLSESMFAWYVVPASAPLIYNLLFQPIIARFQRERKARLKAGHGWHQPIITEVKKATFEMPKAVVTNATTQTMNAVKTAMPEPSGDGWLTKLSARFKKDGDSRQSAAAGREPSEEPRRREPEKQRMAEMPRVPADGDRNTRQ